VQLPAFLRELGEEHFRERVRLGVTTGFAVTAALLFLVVVADSFELLPNVGHLYALALFKLATNSAQWIAVRRDRFVVAAAVVNTITDVVLITAMVYFTGGPASSLFPSYLIVIAIVGGLSNAGITVLLAAMMAVAYSTMVVLIRTGVLVQHPTISDRLALGSEPFGWGFVLADTLKVLFFLVALTAAIASVLRLLQDKERELRQANRELRDAAQRRDEFVATVTHEFKTPIHGILGMSEIVQEGVYGPVNERQDEALDGVRQAGNRLLMMVENLLQWERAQAHQLSVNAAEFDMRRLVTEVIDDVSWATLDKEMEIKIDVQVDTVRSDERLVRHVLKNLISNAMKFTPEKGSVRIVVGREGDALVLSVSDAGPGIAEGEREAIFDEFWQVKESARAYGGTGLGLAVVRRLVGVLGGTIEVRSDEGTTFRVQFPESKPT
jgi:signal transduction histidine kinase